MEIYSIGSSSSGNSYIIKGDKTSILVDMGLSAKKIRQGIQDAGIAESEVQAIFITHEHIDHVRSLHTVAKVLEDSVIYASKGTMQDCALFDKVNPEQLRCIAAGDTVAIGELTVAAFPLSHDANEPLSYTVECGDDRAVLVTDTGVITEEIRAEMENANKLVIESNHEEDMLMMGPYPYNLKRRILSDTGHLSNSTCAQVLCELVRRNHEYGLQAIDVMLAHLSCTNNTPHNASAVVEDELKRVGYQNGVDYNLTIARKEGLTRL